MKYFIGIFFPILLFSQSNYLDNIDTAYNNAKRGVFWALDNIPGSKSSLNSDLIEKDALIAEVKLAKEVEGVKIESVGYYKTYKVRLTLYRSYKSLEKDKKAGKD